MFQSNHSHLHGNNGIKPPLPSTSKPIIKSTKMQNLDSNVVNKFLQAINEPKPTQNGSPKPQKSNLWKQDKPASVEAAPPAWMNKTLKPVDKPPEVPKPTWNAKTLEKPSTAWKPQVSATTTNNVVNGNRAITDWRVKYEEAEKKRKELLGENQKVMRDKSAVERKFNKLEAQFKQLEAEHKEKSQQLNKLSQVSEKVYRDYDNLSSKYEVETSALHRALGAASKWYVENKKLRRESVAHRPNDSSPLDETDGDDHELDELRKTVQDLSQQVGQLKSELNRAKLLEFEAQEQVGSLSLQLEDERQRSEKLGKEIKELRLMREKFESVTVMVQGEMEALRQQRDKALDQVQRLQGESHEAKKERNVLAHQSSLLMGDFSPDDRMFIILQEVEDLKRKLESSEHHHAMEIQALQESLDAKSTDGQIELLEEKLMLAESELQVALERAEHAEQAMKELKANNTTAITNGHGQLSCAPPPPPPPPMPPMLGGCNPPIKRPSVQGHRRTEGDSLEDMAILLGIQRTPKPATQQVGAIDNIINEIKGGKFTLKATEKVQVKKEEKPPAVQEMLSIIGTLKRRPRQSKPCDVLTK